jgi:hypothetical protein
MISFTYKFFSSILLILLPHFKQCTIFLRRISYTQFTTMTSSAPRNTPFLCNHCFKWNTRYTTPVCSTCRTPKDPTCFPAPILFLRDQYVFTPNEWNEHATFPVMQREELRTLRDAYNSALAQEAKEYKASKTTKGKLKAFFKGGKSAKEEEDSIHDIYVARKKEIDARREEKSFLKGIQVDCPALKRKIDDRAWQIRFSVLVVTCASLFLSLLNLVANHIQTGVRKSRHSVPRKTYHEACGTSWCPSRVPSGSRQYLGRKRGSD